MLRIAFIIGSLFLSFHGFSQVENHDFSQIEALQQKAPRNLVIFIHTDWCRYCKAMQNTTLRNAKVADELNRNFYFIDLDAEDKSDISYAGHTFHYKPTGMNSGVNELAEVLATINGNVSYPTLVVLSPENEILFQYGGFINDTDLITVLRETRNVFQSK